jgi:hypothetical protein
MTNPMRVIYADDSSDESQSDQSSPSSSDESQPDRPSSQTGDSSDRSQTDQSPSPQQSPLASSKQLQCLRDAFIAGLAGGAVGGPPGIFLGGVGAGGMCALQK